jgi:Arylsulfotransferase (ASST)
LSKLLSHPGRSDTLRLVRRGLLAGAVSLATLVALGLAPVFGQSAVAAAATTQLIAVSGNGVAMYPAFAAGIHRYGVTTTAATLGTVTVTASTTNATATVWVDGQPASDGTATLTGLTSGEEISVFIKDSAGTAVYSLIYLPAGFPALTVTTNQPGLAPGDVFMTLSDFTGTTPSYETVVDNNGVPLYVRSDATVPTNFTRQPNGNYTVDRPTPTGGSELVELNPAFQQIAAYQTVGLPNTDGHDAILLPNGDRWLLAYVPNQNTGKIDGVIQEQGPHGHVLFQWSTAQYAGLESMVSMDDYVHLNSISLMANGDILASFRHLSQVLDIATSAHDGFAKGDVVWSLGGRDPTLTTVNDPESGPCGQHDATVLPNGDVLMFDDGSESINGSALVCVDPSDPSGPAIARPQSRVVEYAINAAHHTATLVWSYQVTGRDSTFAGSAQRMSNGDTFIGWGGTPTALATEVNAAGEPLWELKDTAGLVSYRALRFPAPDAIAPTVDITQPVKGATYRVGQQVASDFSCTDRGGSNLQSCNGPAVEGQPIDTATPGIHTFSVTAKDGAGNTTTTTRTYHVGTYQPDAQIKVASGTQYLGGNIYRSIVKQRIHQTIAASGKTAIAKARFQNDGTKADRISILGTAGTARFLVSYFAGSRNVTARVIAGTYKTPSLAPGETFTLRVRVTRSAAAKPGEVRTVKLTGRSAHDSARHDAVATIVRALR